MDSSKVSLNGNIYPFVTIAHGANMREVILSPLHIKLGLRKTL